MSIFDDIGGLWDDANNWLAQSGVADFVDTVASDLIPGFNTLQAITGIGPAPGMTYAQQYPPGAQGQFSALPSALQVANNVGGVYSGGATMDFPLMTTQGSGRLPMVFPYSGFLPSGYRLKRLPARRPQAGRAAGDYVVRNRRMNPLNPHALARAERRMSGFTRYVKRHFQTSHLMPKRKTRSSAKKRR